MPRPIDPCERLRRQIAELEAQLERERYEFRNALLPEQREFHRQRIERILSQIDHERALLEEMGCESDIPFPPRPPTISIRIVGVEVTQAIQHYHAHEYLTDPADRGADNSMRLVANKPAWVRVYIPGTFSDLPGVIGTVEVQRRNFGFLYSTLATLSPQPLGTITAQFNPNYAAERSSLNSTLMERPYTTLSLIAHSNHED